uniref:Uncharacterized protein n=1 Tax=Rhizophora mucronata TaxID=61149 RepID=A0A2P2PPH4_RHIMU
MQVSKVHQCVENVSKLKYHIYEKCTGDWAHYHSTQ